MSPQFFFLFILGLFAFNESDALPPGKSLIAEKILSVKARKQEILHYAFQKDDEIIVEVEFLKGSPLNALNIGQYKGSKQYEGKQIKHLNQVIKVQETGIYEFDFNNLNFSGSSNLKIKIYRLSPENTPFNSQIKYIESWDTVYVSKKKTVVVDSPRVRIEKTRTLIKNDTIFSPIINRIERVHSRLRPTTKNYSNIYFTIPKDDTLINKEDLRIRKTVAWTFSIYVEGEGTPWFEKANKLIEDSDFGKYLMASKLVPKQYLAIGVLAIQGISVFSNSPKGENVIFNLKDDNGEILAQGNSVTAVQNIKRPLFGTFTLNLTNDNYIDGINVKVIVLAIIEQKEYKEKIHKIKEGKLIKEKRIVQEPVLKKVLIPTMY